VNATKALVTRQIYSHLWVSQGRVRTVLDDTRCVGRFSAVWPVSTTAHIMAAEPGNGERQAILVARIADNFHGEDGQPLAAGGHGCGR
jgi:hypothetical protein